MSLLLLFFFGVMQSPQESASQALPSAPSVRVVVTTPTNATVRITPAARYGYGVISVNYTLFWRRFDWDDSFAQVKIANVAQDQVISELSPDFRYYIFVMETGANGSSNSTLVEMTTKQAVPYMPVMAVFPSNTSLFVMVTTFKRGRFAISKHCMTIIELNQERCIRENDPYGPGPYKANATFANLSAYTNYTVEGWIVNHHHLDGPKVTKTVFTLFDPLPSAPRVSVVKTMPTTATVRITPSVYSGVRPVNYTVFWRRHDSSLTRAGLAYVEENQVISGLLPDKRYYVFAMATNPAGSTNSTMVEVITKQQVPLMPGLTVIPSRTSLVVTVTKKAGRYAVLYYCAAIAETQVKKCVDEKNPYKPIPHEANATFSNLSADTHYTVQGWLVNNQYVVGPRRTTQVRTLSNRCKGETTMDGKGSFNWPNTSTDGTVTVTRPCTFNPRMNASRKCRFDGDNVAWTLPNTSNCLFESKPMRDLDDVLRAKPEDVDSELLAEFAKGMLWKAMNWSQSLLTVVSVTDDLALIAKLLRPANKGAQRATEEIVKTIIDTVSQLITFEVTILTQGQQSANTSSRIVTALELIAGTIKLSDEREKLIVTKNLAFGIKQVDSDSSSPVIFEAVSSSASETLVEYNFTFPHYEKPVVNFVRGSELSFSVPPGVFSQHRQQKFNNQSITNLAQLSFLLFQNDKLFQPERKKSTSEMVVSKVINVRLSRGGTMSLENPVKMTFTVSPKEMDQRLLAYDYSCRYWSERKVWSKKGCRLITTENLQRTQQCVCDHLSTFALLLEKAEKASTQSLSLAVYVGCGLALPGIICGLISFCKIGYLHHSISHRTIFAHSSCLIVLLVTFIAGAEATSSGSTCKFVGLLSHFLLLSAFGWVGMQAVYVYFAVRDTVQQKRKLLLLAFLLSCGLPLIIVLVTAGATEMTAYGNNDFCWISKQSPLYTALCLPIGLLLFFNLAVIGKVKNLLKARATSPETISFQQQPGKLQLLQFTTMVSTVLFLGWVIGGHYLLHRESTLKYMFAVFIAVHGLLLFAVEILSVKEIRREWLAYLRQKTAMQEQRELDAMRYDVIMVQKQNGRSNDKSDIYYSSPTETKRNARSFESPAEQEKYREEAGYACADEGMGHAVKAKAPAKVKAVCELNMRSSQSCEYDYVCSTKVTEVKQDAERTNVDSDIRSTHKKRNENDKASMDIDASCYLNASTSTKKTPFCHKSLGLTSKPSNIKSARMTFQRLNKRKENSAKENEYEDYEFMQESSGAKHVRVAPPHTNTFRQTLQTAHQQEITCAYGNDNDDYEIMQESNVMSTPKV